MVIHDEPMIYFDNAATTFPKPLPVMRAVGEAMVRYGGNPGRGGHSMSLAAGEAVYKVRERAAKMFGADPENVVFTLNCTHALNMAIKGIVDPGDHVIISSLEHNSVARPVNALTAEGVSYSVFSASPDDEITLISIEKAITPLTKAVICTLGSNVTGQLLPYRRIGELCRRNDLIFIADGAQVCGTVSVSLRDDNINILCMPGHKGLYGISGTGMLISDGKYHISPIMEGGTGSTSLELAQPDFLPDSLESGTVNTVGIIALGAGMDFVMNTGMEKIRSHENHLCRILMEGLSEIDGVKIYRTPGAEYLPIVLFNIAGVTPEAASAMLSDEGFALRAGLHCSGFAHRSIGTLPDGGIRFAPSVFNNETEVRKLIMSVRRIRDKYTGLQ
ncbi:MAG: aminotransferase class V-fold PLP-dependent enzyme [Huintestinicola sp.]